MENVIKLIKQCSIMYVENDQTIADSMLRLYNAIFKKVYFASDGQKALELFNKHKKHIDLLIIDIDLPIITGIEMVTRIRAKYGYKLPVIFTTNHTNDNVLLQCLKLGTSDYIIKPVQHKTHLGILIKVLKPIYDHKHIYVMNQELEIYQQSANSQLLISKTDLKGHITYVNDLFSEVSGYSKEELLDKPHNIVRHENMPKEIFQELWETIQKGEIWSGHVENKAKDGSSYYVDAKIFPIKDSEGNIVEYMSFRQDVTLHVDANNRAKNALKETKLSYSKVYAEAVEKAKVVLAKELENLELIAQREKESAKVQISKRALAEQILFKVTEEKDEEILKWKSKLKEAGKVITQLSMTNKKITTDTVSLKNNYDTTLEKLEASQKKIIDVDKNTEILLKRIYDKDDVIKHLEEELVKYKNRK